MQIASRSDSETEGDGRELCEAAGVVRRGRGRTDSERLGPRAGSASSVACARGGVGGGKGGEEDSDALVLVRASVSPATRVRSLPPSTRRLPEFLLSLFSHSTFSASERSSVTYRLPLPPLFLRPSASPHAPLSRPPQLIARWRRALKPSRPRPPPANVLPRTPSGLSSNPQRMRRQSSARHASSERRKRRSAATISTACSDTTTRTAAGRRPSRCSCSARARAGRARP